MTTTIRIELDLDTMSWLLDREGREETTRELQRQDDTLRENRRWEELDREEQEILDRLHTELEG